MVGFTHRSQPRLARVPDSVPPWDPGAVAWYGLPFVCAALAVLATQLTALPFEPLWLAGLACLGSLLASLWLRARIARRVGIEFSAPLTEACRIVEQLRGGDLSEHVPDVGAQAVRNLGRRINQSMAAAIQNSQLSQAKLVSVESAFDRIHAVLRTFSEGVFVVGRRNEIVLVNPAGRRYLHSALDQPLEGRPLIEFLDHDIAQHVLPALQRIADGDSAHEVCSHLQHGDRILDVEVVRVHSGPVGAGRDADFGTLVVIDDVTTILEVARLKDEFLSSVSHELRTPLTNIVAYTEILSQMSEQTADSQEFLAIIQSESRRLHRLVDSVLEYSQLENGRGRWDFEVAPIDEVLRSCLSVFAERATEHSVSIEWDDCTRAHVHVDRARLQQVFGNVIDNAIKFSPKGGVVRIEVTVDGDSVATRISDAGPGVPAAQREAIFERLTQLGDALVDKPAGTGMGLAICAAILERLGGTIRCEDSQLGGASFVVRLPVAIPTALESSEAASSVG